MNTIDTSKTGGHPLYLQDVGFIQEAHKEVIEGLITSLNASSYILSGCVKTLQSAGVWAISEGFVVLNKEVFKVNAHTATFLSESDPLYFKIVQRYAEPSPVVYKESGVQNVHIERYSEVTTEVTEWIFGLPTIPMLIDRISRSPIKPLTRLNLWNGRLEYRVVNGVFYLNGDVYMNVPDVNEQNFPICEIPLDKLPYFVGEWTYGNIAPSMINYNYTVEYGFYQITIPRIIRRFGLGDIVDTVVAQVHANLSFGLLLRKGYLQIITPGVWPAGTEAVIYKFSNVSWLTAPQ